MCDMRETEKDRFSDSNQRKYTHTFVANERGERYISILTFAIFLALPIFWYFGVRIMNSDEPFSLIYLLFELLVVAITFIMILYVCYMWHAYLFAKQTEITIDLITRQITYNHNGKTLTFMPEEVESWYSDLGIKYIAGKLSRLTEHDSVMILRSGEVVYFPSWLWEGDYFWLNTKAFESNIKFFLDAHYRELGLPECQTARTYKYMFPKM